MMKYRIPTKNEWRMRDADNSDRCWWWLASLFMAFTLVLIAASCQEKVAQAGIAEEGLPATVRLEVMPDAASQAQTRADESAIKDLHVLVYTKEGELIGKGYNDNSPTITVNTRSGSDYTIYAIANTGKPTLFDGGVALAEAQLKAMKTDAIDSWDDLSTASHLIMVGCETEVEIRAGSSTLKDGITVTRMAAKVTLNIKTKKGSGITIKDYQVCSLPTESYYVAGTTDASTAVTDGEKTTVDAAAVEKTFLMYENRKGIVSSITAQKDKGADKAPANATYVVINGEANGYKATWRVYLGENNSSDFNMKRNSWYTYNITLSRPGTDGADTRVNVEETIPTVVGGNSNCYMVKPGNAVTIPVERANESTIHLTGSTLINGTYYQLQSSTTWTASLVWESSKGLITLSETTGRGPTGCFKVTATNATTQGNAMVAIKNASNEILWSWHIWVTTYDGSSRFINNNGNHVFTFMNRELGATDIAGQPSACGLFYQWGRKDPFPGIGQGSSWSVADNTDPIRVYNASGILCEITKKLVPNVIPNNLTNATRNPDTFYYSTDALKDWFVYNSSSAQNDNLWSGDNLNLPAAKSVFDPCPNGWRIPSSLNGISPFAGMTASNSSWGNSGRTWSGTGGYFPTSGTRKFDSGKIYYVGAGYFWLGTFDHTDAYLFYFTEGAVWSMINGNNRANGVPVRCCLDNL